MAGAQPTRSPPLKIATWNVNSIRARLPRLLERLALARPDVLCLQETKCPDDQFPVGELRQAGSRRASARTSWDAGARFI